MTRHATLPFPPPKLSPNARLHWAQKAKSAGHYKNQCLLELQASGLPKKWNGPVIVAVEFVVPDRRKRDFDNMIGAFKYGLDAISLHINIDDSEFDPRYSVVREPVKNGAVNVTISEKLLADIEFRGSIL